jgi:peptide/nickel transport system ATP-binding protein
VSTPDPLLEIENLKVIFHGDQGQTTHAVDCVNLAVERGQTLGLVGESGCGKTVTALAIMGLLSKNSAEVSGQIHFDGADLLSLPDRAMRNMRGDRLAMIFQEPMTSLNPLMTVGRQISEAIALHQGLSRRDAFDQAVEMLRRVHIPEPERRVHAYDYPHRLSGGMRQRAMIALALACDPTLLIADEPTTALDVTIQAQILDLIRELKASTGAAIILISHDLGVVAELCDKVAVMYAGEIVECAPAATLFVAPQHPYTVGLLGAVPRLDDNGGDLTAIDGLVPNLATLPPGCRFAPRCPFAREFCTHDLPKMSTVGIEHTSRCMRAPLERILT